MKQILEKTSTRTGLISLFVCQLIVGGILGTTLAKLSNATGGYGILDFEVGYTVEKVNELFSSYGTVGIELYKQVHVIDLFNPLIYSLLFSSLLYIFFKESEYAWLAYLGFLCGGLDYLENIFLFNMLNAYPNINSYMIGLSSTVSIIKHSVLYITILIFIMGMVRWIRLKRKYQVGKGESRS